MYYFCTYFNKNYLDKGLALYHSLVRHCSPFTLWVLCMDDETCQVLAEMQLPHAQLIPLSDFENGDSRLQEAKQNRSLIEYYFTCSPSLPLYILNHHPEVDVITYLDADLYFFSPIEPVYRELGDRSILIIAHRFPTELREREVFGIYNVGLLSFRRGENSIACLSWWRERCLEWCYDRVENGRFADQKYLDDWPDRFSGVVVLQHKGAGLAPWNIANYRFEENDSLLFVEREPLILYHFHGLKKLNNSVFDTNISDYRVKLPDIIKKNVYIPYIKDIEATNHILEKKFKSLCDRNPSIRGVQVANHSPRVNISHHFTGVKSLLLYLKKIINKDLIRKSEVT